MNTAIFLSIFLPFAGTVGGAAAVFLQRGKTHEAVRRCLTGFAAGIMTAAAVWSLLIPALSLREDGFAFLPAAVGIWLGALFTAVSNRLIPPSTSGTTCPVSGAKRMLFLAVTLHNLPEGMAVGILCAGFLEGSSLIPAAEVIALAVGVALQNIPEGAVISLPLRAEGNGQCRSFLCGCLSGAAEPLGAVLAILAAEAMLPLMPYLLGFAAGAMLYVVAEELLPDAEGGSLPFSGAIFFIVGFILMMSLDTALG